jgi:hypothetical protein
MVRIDVLLVDSLEDSLIWHALTDRVTHLHSNTLRCVSPSFWISDRTGFCLLFPLPGQVSGISNA